jgi:hypothetical protein
MSTLPIEEHYVGFEVLTAVVTEQQSTDKTLIIINLLADILIFEHIV